VFARLLEATNIDLSKDEKECFHEISTWVQKLLKLIMKQEHISEKVDKFNLSVGLLGLTSNSLERCDTLFIMIASSKRVSDFFSTFLSGDWEAWN